MKFICALLLLLSSVAMANDDQKLSSLSLSLAEQKCLEDQRNTIASHLSPTDQASKYPSAAGKLGLLRALLAAHTFTGTQTYELQSMGVVLGDAFVADMGFHWIVVEDAHGRDPAIRYRDTSVVLFPLAMISKRVEDGQDVDVFELYNSVADDVYKLIDDGA